MKRASVAGFAAVLALTVIAAACGDGGDNIVPLPVNLADAGVVDAPSDAAPTSLCVNGQLTADYPPGPYAIAPASVLPPELVWQGPSGAVAIKEYFEPCAAKSRLLVIRSSAAWCGTCLWHATHTTRLFGDARFAGRLRLLELVIADEDNLPATSDSATRYRARLDVPAGLDFRVGIDVEYMLSSTLKERAPLPEYLLVDTRTMKVLTAVGNPDPSALLGTFATELAALDALPAPAPVVPTKHDGLLTDDQWDLLQAMTVPAAPPADPTNEYADVPAAATLGGKLFADLGLSPSGTVGCITCHDPGNAFGDGLAQSVGVAKGDRNAPSIVLASHSRWMFWDGRADTLWMQALGPPENAIEFNSSRLFVVRQIAARYAADYATVFGAKYPFPDLTGLPASGKPGDAAYDALPQAKRDAITRVYVNVAKSIAAFERTFRVRGSDLDRYAAGDTSVLGTQQRRALASFFAVGCAQCHYGPRLTDDAFHALRFPTGRQDGAAYRGRADVLLGLKNAEFIASSKWSDATAAAKPVSFTAVPTSMVGAFKTPTLRGVTKSSPYGHGGRFRFASDIAKHYGTRAKDVSAADAVGTVEEWVPLFKEDIQADLPSLLDVLTADPL